MHLKFKGSVSIIAIAIFFIVFSGKLFSQSSVSSHNTSQVNKGLKDYYSKYFPIGVAVNIRSLQGEDSALIVREFNSITPENDMKIGPIHPAEDEYNWKNADAIVAFAERNKLRVRGHNLVWHYESQTPKWIFKDKDGKQA